MADAKKLEVVIDDDLKELIRVAVVIAEKVKIHEANEELWKEIEDISKLYRVQFDGKAPSEIEELRYARDLYKSVGINPTKTRPSSEALLRRVMQGKKLYKINNLVDLWNLESLQFQLPVGLYDIANIASERVVVRRGKKGEGFEGIRKGRVNVENRLCVADEAGAFGSPTSDSARTAISESTTAALALIFATPQYPEDKLFRMLDEGARRTKQYCKATIIASKLVRRY